MPKLLVCADDDYLFQSAPGREAGRCAASRLRPSAVASFNPRPAVRPGDARFVLGLVRPVLVSIRARP